MFISGPAKSDQNTFEEKVQKMADVGLAGIIDVKEIQSLMDDFYKLTHIPIGLNDLKGNVLVNVGWQDICTKFHRVHPEACKHCIESRAQLSLGIPPGEYKLYKCKNNMWDVATPIIVNGQHTGNIFSGQFFFEDELLDYELFRSQAKKYGFNETEYIAALEKVPRFSRNAVDTSMAFFMTFANMLSQLSYSNIKLAQSLAERDALMDALRESEKRERVRSDELTVVLDAVPAVVLITHDPGALKMTGNRISCEWLQLPERANLSKAAPEGERPETYKLFKGGLEIPLADMPVRIAASGKKVHDYEFEIVYSDGTMRHLLGDARPLRDDQGNPRGAVAAFIDITERKKAEIMLKETLDNLEKLVEERTEELKTAFNSLKESEQSLSEAQKLAHIGNWKWDIVTDEAYWSDEMYSIYGLKPQEFEVTYKLFLTYVHSNDRDYVDNALKKALNGEPLDIDYRIILADDSERVVHAKSEVIFDENYTPVSMRVTVQDITERKKSEEKLQESEEKYRNIVEIANEGILVVDAELRITYYNKKMMDMLGYNQVEGIGRPIWDFISEEGRTIIKQTIENGRNDVNESYELELICKDGSSLWAFINDRSLFDKDGKFMGSISMLTDITERKKAEEALANIETARKKEIHHRIKNNLQVISSLLDLQAEQFKGRKDIKDSEVLEAFRESQDRVVSMALIHEELHEGGGDNEVNFSPYLEKLVENLFKTYRLGNTDISLNMYVEETILFDMDTGVPLGMVVNELVSNSLKHAFIGRDKGEIRIKLHREESRNEGKSTNFILTISDNGIGIPENLNIGDLDSLGFQLVTTLVDQLDGEFKLKRNNGTEFTMRFTVTEINKQASAPVLK